MAKFFYTYKSYPDCPRATEYSQEREKGTVGLNGLVGVLSLGASIGFFVCAFFLFSDGDWSGFLSALLIVTLVAFFDAYVLVLRNNNTECNLKIILLEESVLIKAKQYKEQMQTLEKEKLKEKLSSLKQYYLEEMDILKKENRKANVRFLKKYFLYFFWGMLVAFSVVGMIQGVIDESAGLLILFLFLILGLLGVFYFTLPKGKALGKEVLAKKRARKEKSEKDVIECNEKLFCRKCGTQLLKDSLYCNKCGTKVETL